MGLGYTWVLIGIAAFRELLGNGTLLGAQIMPEAYQPILFFTLPPGGFMVFALFISFNLWLKRVMARADRGCRQGGRMNLAKIFISAFLIDNIVLMRFLALCPFIGMSVDVSKIASAWAWPSPS